MDQQLKAEELRAWVEWLSEESDACLGREGVEVLREASLRSVACGGEVDEEVEVLAPGGDKVYVPVGQLPEAWANLLHVFCWHDNDYFREFTPLSGWVVVDLGAYLGFYTVYAARRVGRRGLVVAVEPNPWARETLYRTLEASGYVDRVRVDPRAVASRPGTVRLYISCYWANSSLIREYAEESTGICGELEVPAVTLEELLRDHGLERVDLLKMDVEGLELEILRASKKVFEGGAVRRVVVEVHQPYSTPEEVAEVLEGYGYHVSVLEPEAAHAQAFVYASRERLAWMRVL